MSSQKIFISYRRGLDDDSAGRLFDRMSIIFGEDRLFRDVDASRDLVGLDFHDVLSQRVADCSAFIAVIGREWIDNVERLQSDNDFVRIEVETALSRQDIRVIPVLIGETEMPKASDLPDPLKPLARRGAIRLTNEGYSSAVDTLVSVLREASGDLDSAVSAPDASTASASRPDPSDQGADTDTPDRVAAYADSPAVVQHKRSYAAESADDTPPESGEPEPAILEPAQCQDEAEPDIDAGSASPIAARSHGLKLARALSGVAIAGVLIYWIVVSAQVVSGTEGLLGRFAALKVDEPVVLARAAPPPPEPQVEPVKLNELRSFLSEEISSGAVGVFSQGNTTTIRVSGQQMFPSGSDQLAQQYRPLIDRVARALDEDSGNIIVVGHTDNVQIRSSRFPSNVHLSLARAQAVMEQMAKHLSAPERLSAEGRADSEPIANNVTREGRAMNRRIEIVLVQAG